MTGQTEKPDQLDAAPAARRTSCDGIWSMAAGLLGFTLTTSDALAQTFSR
jgi:hypothetical protein